MTSGSEPVRRRLARALVPGVAAGIVLLWGALPYLPGQIDDPFIVFAYAHRVVEHGEIAWNTGERVEGYSSALHLAVMVVGCLLGFDLSVFARVVSFSAAAATLALLLRPRFGPGRAWLALLVAGWQPFQFWSVAAMETSLATFLGAGAWPLLFGGRAGWAGGCLALAVFSLARPEGAAWLGAGLLLRFRYARGWGAPERVVVSGLLFLATCHAARVHYFGDLMPTPWLVKIVAVEAFEDGLRELAPELLSAAPLVALALMLRRAIPIWVWMPLAIQCALLVRAGGDWMGNARFLLPGVVASVGAAFVAGRPRGVPKWLPLVLLPLAALAFAREPALTNGAGPRWRDPWFLRRPLAAVRAPWSVPLLDDVAFLVERIPVGAGAGISDVGLPGNLDDIRIWDNAGLTDRAVARIIAGAGEGISDEMKARYDDPTALWCLRYALTGTGADPGDAWLKEMFPETATAPAPISRLFWRCRAGGAPGDDVIVARWERLLSRFPRQDGIRWRYARALLASGRSGEAIGVGRAATWVDTDADGWIAFPGVAGATYAPGRGWPMYASGVLTSSRLPDTFWAERDVVLDVDDPGTDGAHVVLRWDPPCGDALEITVTGASTVPAPDCSQTTPRSLVVEFLNDEARSDFDRNVYATLAPRPYSGSGTSVAPPALTAPSE